MINFTAGNELAAYIRKRGLHNIPILCFQKNTVWASHRESAQDFVNGFGPAGYTNDVNHLKPYLESLGAGEDSGNWMSVRFS